MGVQLINPICHVPNIQTEVQYMVNGGDKNVIASYSSQNLVRKITEKYDKQINVALLSKRKGNIIFSCVLSVDDARAKLIKDTNQFRDDETIGRAALLLNAQILQLPKSKTPNPASVQNLKECASQIPRPLNVFFRCLHNDLQEDNSTDSCNHK